MSYRTKAVAWIACVIVLGCSGGPRKTSKQTDAGAPDGGAMNSGDSGNGGDGDDDPPAPGTDVDVDNDGVDDGVAVDIDGDGDADGVDTDGDGMIDEPLPGTYVPPDAGPLPFPTDENGAVLCDGAPCACSDGNDNDNDGQTDLQDPECVSSWDNDESSFATGISGDNRDDACQDCFFDGNSGSGNDGCYLPSSCLSEGNASSGQGRCSACEQSDQCVDFCKAFTPNGCDCFGCCTVRLANGTTKNVALGAGCQIDGNDLSGCNECVPNDSCVNNCGTCELCPGKSVEDLPPECFTGGDGDGDADGGTGGDGDGDGAGDGGTGGGTPGYTCDDGATKCGSGLPACPTGSACDFGCCVKLPVVL